MGFTFGCLAVVTASVTDARFELDFILAWVYPVLVHLLVLDAPAFASVCVGAVPPMIVDRMLCFHLRINFIYNMAPFLFLFISEKEAAAPRL